MQPFQNWELEANSSPNENPIGMNTEVQASHKYLFGLFWVFPLFYPTFKGYSDFAPALSSLRLPPDMSSSTFVDVY